jgi:hypothetical protein
VSPDGTGIYPFGEQFSGQPLLLQVSPGFSLLYIVIIGLNHIPVGYHAEHDGRLDYAMCLLSGHGRLDIIVSVLSIRLRVMV